MRTSVVTTYDKEDIEKLNHMSKDDVVATLNWIDDGWLPTNYVYDPKDDEEYTESQYDATKLHKAVRQAIQMLSNTKE